jgi:hypothetical protein
MMHKPATPDFVEKHKIDRVQILSMCIGTEENRKLQCKAAKHTISNMKQKGPEMEGFAQIRTWCRDEGSLDTADWYR